MIKLRFRPFNFLRTTASLYCTAIIPAHIRTQSLSRYQMKSQILLLIVWLVGASTPEYPYLLILLYLLIPYSSSNQKLPLLQSGLSWASKATLATLQQDSLPVSRICSVLCLLEFSMLMRKHRRYSQSLSLSGPLNWISLFSLLTSKQCHTMSEHHLSHTHILCDVLADLHLLLVLSHFIDSTQKHLYMLSLGNYN